MKTSMIKMTLLLSILFTANVSTLANTSDAGAYLDEHGVWHETPGQKDQRMKWWREARFGMFIHWGLPSVTAGKWKGRWQKNEYSEWIMAHFKITSKENRGIAREFNPIHFDANEWAKMARDAGMKYVVFVAKHHDGFALFDTAASDFDIMDASPFKRDIVAELAEACKTYGVKLCFYYSQSMDWNEPDALGNFWEFHDNIVKPKGYENNSRKWIRTTYPDYMKRKAIPQITELLTQYGQIGLIWYDTPRSITKEQSQTYINLIRRYQPNAIVNSRIHESGKMGDYGSTGDNSIPGERQIGDWESPGTMNDTWAYRSDDHNWRTPTDMIRNLIDIVSRGGNYLLNVGPKADGTFPYETIVTLREFKKWMQINSEAIYGTVASPLGELRWGQTTEKPEENKLYLHVYQWPYDGKLKLSGLETKVTKAHLLTSEGKVALNYETGPALVIDVPKEMPNRHATVICLELAGEIKVDESKIERAQTVFKEARQEAQDKWVKDSFRLYVENAKIRGHHIKYNKDEKYIYNFYDPREYLEFGFRVRENPGNFDIHVRYSSELGSGWYVIDYLGQKVYFKIDATGSMHQSKTVKVGTINIPRDGHKSLTLRPVGDGKYNPMHFKWIKLF
ncbi:MAG: alpha-L-fucosidase [Sedimentisphaerales bacterium]|nr:alpha-L-fucosidase [Sedimentisphaerales bacterium]